MTTPESDRAVVDFFAKVGREETTSPGVRDRLVHCGRVACEALGLDDNNNSPDDVRTAINRLRRERADLEIQLHIFRLTDGQRG